MLGMLEENKNRSGGKLREENRPPPPPGRFILPPPPSHVVTATSKDEGFPSTSFLMRCRSLSSFTCNLTWEGEGGQPRKCVTHYHHGVGGKLDRRIYAM